MTENEPMSFLQQLRLLIKDSIDYVAAVLHLQQARFTQFSLSIAVFVVLLALTTLLGVAAFVVLNIALGVWLTRATGHAGWSLLILGGFYGLLTMGLGIYSLRWLKKLSS